MICRIVILIFGYALAQDADCDHTENIGANETYYIKEEYCAGRTCRYVGNCPDGYNCKLDCNLSIPPSTNCSADKLLLSRSGDLLLAGEEAYCGSRNLSAVSSERSISLGLIIPDSSPGGKIMCTLSAQQVQVQSARSTDCRCGERKKTRIVGGEEVKMDEYPMMAAIMNSAEETIYCGGVIISSRHVMTAAHCVDRYRSNPNALFVTVGNHYVEKNISVKSRYKIIRFIIHEKYNNDTYDYDVSLVALKRKIQFTASIQPVCLPFKYQDTDLAGETVTILGWGTTSPSGPTSDALLKVDVNVIGQESCRASEGIITDRHICTFSKGKDACQYDSGGPVLLTDPTTGLLFSVGIVSNGYMCGTGRPGVNARITALLDWINKYTSDLFCYK